MKKLLAIMMSVCLIVSGMTGLVFTAAAEGTSWDTAIEIGTPDAFAAMTASNTGKYYKLTADIDLTKTTTTYEPSVFAGHLDGQGHKVNIEITKTSDYAGIFTELSGTFTVQNLVITGSVTALGSAYCSYAGGLAGRVNWDVVTAGSVLYNITNQATITGRNYIGGILGYGHGGSWCVTASKLYNEGSINGSGHQPNYIGGIFGIMAKINLTESANYGPVTGYANVGGIIGRSEQGNAISKCYNTASVTGTGGAGVGGIVGVTAQSPSFTDCYNIGTVSSSGTYAGGIIGQASAAGVKINNCYDTKNGSVAAAANTASNVTFSKCYYVAASETDSFDGTTAVTESGLKGADLGTSYYVIGNPQSWQYAYPQLTANPHKVVEPPKGTIDNPYQLETEDDVKAIADDPDAYYEVADNITLTAAYESCAFSGNLNGCGYTITLAGKPLFTELTGSFAVSYLTLGGTVTGTGDCVGALANKVSNATVQNGASLTNITNNAAVSSDGSYVGGIIGQCYGNWAITTIDNLHNNGAITGKNYVGGLFGASQKMNIKNSSNTGSVSGTQVHSNDDYIGGITGCQIWGGKLENCYNSGTVTGNVAAGLCAWVSNGTMVFTNCYNAGNINGIIGYTGGLVGWTNTTSTTLTNCYNAGNVNGAAVYNPIAATTVYEENDRLSYYTMSNCYYLSADEAHDDSFANTTPKNRENLAAVSLDSAFGSSASYPFPQLTANTHKTAYTVYQVNATAGENGSIAPSGAVYVTNGAPFTAVVTPDAYYVAAVKLNDVDQPAAIDEDGNLTLAISGDSTVAVSFTEMDPVAPTITSVETPWKCTNGSITFAKRTAGYKMTITEYGVAYATAADSFTNWDGKESAAVKKAVAQTTTLNFGIQLKWENLSNTTYYTMPYVIYTDAAGAEQIITGAVVENAL